MIQNDSTGIVNVSVPTQGHLMTESSSRHSRWIRRTAISFKVFVIAVAAVVISGSLYLLAWLAFDPLTAEEWTTGLQPTLFQSTIDPELLNFSDAAYA